MNSHHIVILSTTHSEEEAEKIAKTLVSKKLVSGVSIVPGLRSIYRWKNEVCDEKEVMLVMRTRMGKFKEIKHEYKNLHSYECPELIAISITDGLPDYLKWITDNT